MIHVVFNRGINGEWTEEFATVVAARSALVNRLRELTDFTEEKICEEGEFSTYETYNDNGFYGAVYRWTSSGELISIPYQGEVRA